VVGAQPQQLADSGDESSAAVVHEHGDTRGSAALHPDRESVLGEGGNGRAQPARPFDFDQQLRGFPIRRKHWTTS
jgi:hypothetical protein